MKIEIALLTLCMAGAIASTVGFLIATCFS